MSGGKIHTESFGIILVSTHEGDPTSWDVKLTDSQIKKFQAFLKTQRDAATQTENKREEGKDYQDTLHTAAAMSLEMVRISPGDFFMGSPASEKGHQEDETLHKVRITRAFEMSKYKVTRGLWKLVMGSTPDENECGLDCPVLGASWEEIQVFLTKLNAKYPGKSYRLPTEAEWEFAARAGDQDAVYGNLDAIAWYQGNSGDALHPVGQKQPNSWGLFDFIGDAYEYCQDWYGPYPVTNLADPKGPAYGTERVRRGGYYGDTNGQDYAIEITDGVAKKKYYAEGRDLRAAFREKSGPKTENFFTGFRLARSLETTR
jgi:formylglycine-generating enzyme required for sulfatase activity